jgi:hypothetical protein
MQLNEFHEDFDLKNLRRHCFEVVTDYSQTLMLHFNELRYCVNDAVRTFVRRMLNDRRIHYNEFDNRFIN